MSRIFYYIYFYIFNILGYLCALRMKLLTGALPLKGNKNVPAYYNQTNERILWNKKVTAPANFTINASYENYGEQDIVFPNSDETTSEQSEQIPRIDNTPKCARGGTFCENVETYPYERLKNLLDKTHVQTDLFGQDESSSELLNRIGGDSDEMFVCKSIERTVYPQVGRNKNNKWKYIINQGEQDGYIQGVRVETCMRPGDPCDFISSLLPNGYISSCKQKYVYRRLLSLNDGGQPMPDIFQMPSACCCSYRKDPTFLSRFGLRFSPVQIR